MAADGPPAWPARPTSPAKPAKPAKPDSSATSRHRCLCRHGRAPLIALALFTSASGLALEPAGAPAPHGGGATLLAPATVPTAQAFVVEWQGPAGRYDSIVLIDPSQSGINPRIDGRVLRRKLLHHGEFHQRRVTLTGPAQPGRYQLRYWDADNKTLLGGPALEVTGTPNALEAPATVTAGQAFEVVWAGPGEPYDTVQLFDPTARGGRGRILHSQRVHGDHPAGRPVTLSAPTKPGSYRLRYWNSMNKTILSTRELSVTAAR